MEFRILGPLEVIDDGRELSIRGRKLQALLALLLLNAGETVSRDRLIADLWGDDPPATAAKTLQVHVSRLRRELGDVVVTRGGGYAIEVAPHGLDLSIFEALVAEGREALADHRPADAEARLREALALWRGPPLPELADEPFAQVEIGRLEQIRLDAIEDHTEAELSLGHHAQAIETLEGLVARHPYRERPRALLMLALYRSGRQADALDVYRDARSVLVEAQGIEPGPQLRDLHEAILAQDPALHGAAARELAPPAPASTPAAATGAAPAPARLGPRRGLRRFALPAAGVAALLVAAALLAAALTGGEDEPQQPLTDDSHAIVMIDPRTNEVTTAATVGTNPGPLAFEPRSRSLWVGNVDDESVTRIDLRPVRTGRTIAIGERPGGLAAVDGAVWVAGASRASPFVTARRIDTRFDTARRPVRVESLPGGTARIALGGRTLWVAPSSGRLTALDPATGSLRGRRIDAGHSPTTVAADARAVWVADAFAGIVTRIDPRTGVPDAIPVAGGPADIALGAGAVWVTASLDDSVARIDPATGSVRSTTPVGRRPAGVAVGAGAVWVANSGDGTVSRLHRGTGRVTHTIPVGGSPQDVVVADGRLWVSVRPRRPLGEGGSGGVVRVETEEDVDFLDPALAYATLSWQIQYATCAKLVNYPDERGPAGARLSPELAETLPRPTDGGRTYTFRIRQGFRFSPPSGEQVTARTLKDSIERSMNPRMRSPAAGFMRDVVGASAFANGSARHVSGITAAGGTLTIRLAGPSSNLLYRLSLPFFCAVPAGTPIDPEGLRDVPAAGPYYVVSHVPGQEIVLHRNPNYRGPRPQRPDQVRITVGAGQADTIARIESGEVDYAPEISNPRNARRLNSRYGATSAAARAGRQRYFVTPALQLAHLLFNTSRGPFVSARLRRAVNYAIDRRALSREGLFTGVPARPTDQYLPPGMSGYREAEIYPLTPDIEKARELAGNMRRSIVLYALSDSTHLRFAKIVKANLRRIGMDVQIRALGQSLYLRLERRGEPFDIALDGWQSDYPDPLDFLHRLDSRTLGPDANVNLAYFNDPDYDRKLDAADGLGSPARELALGRLDVEVARAKAPWAAVSNERTHSFFSARMGCQLHNPVFGLDLAALCIRD